MKNDDENVRVWFNPQCSKCRTVMGILAERDVDAVEVRYLEHAPTRAQLEEVLRLVGSDDPRVIARTKDEAWQTLGLDGASREQVLDALATHPTLIERPIVIKGDRAVVARPAERVLELLGER